MSELCAKSPSRLRNSRVRKVSAVGFDDIIENFWAVELTSEHREEVWSFKVEDEEDDQNDQDKKEEECDRDYMMHQLNLKMATLGTGLMKGEEHVVQVETVDKDGKLLKVPLINLIAGVANTICINAEFTDKHKVVFRLTDGTGPVYLSGSCIQEFPEEVLESQDESLFSETEATATDEFDDSDEDDDEEDEEDHEEDEEDDEDDDDDDDDEEEMEMDTKGKKGKGGMKRKSPSVKGSKAKQRGKLDSKEKSEEDSEEDDEDDDEEAIAETKKKRGKATKSPKPSKSPKDNSAAKKAAAAEAAKADKKKRKSKAK